ncbi:hypothetical protein BASA81_014380 [Batrachochytrium salamandrivorans]|nr:hypothetical protein BASA81_014380 [Batrachochytrium salamandrivorans]
MDSNSTRPTNRQDMSDTQRNLGNYQQQNAAVLTTRHYARVIQQPVLAHSCGITSKGPAPFCIEPCIIVQLYQVTPDSRLDGSIDAFQDFSSLVAHAYLTSCDETSDLSSFVEPLQSPLGYPPVQDHTLSYQQSVDPTSLLPQPTSDTHYLHTALSSSPHIHDRIDTAHSSSPLPLHKVSYTSPLHHIHMRASTSAGCHHSKYAHQQATHQPQPPTDPAPRSDIDISDPAKKGQGITVAPLIYSSEQQSASAKDPGWVDITQDVLFNQSSPQIVHSLCGTQVTAADSANDQVGSTGVYFFFPGLGVCISGRFKIHIIISEMPAERISEVTTAPFTSYSAHDWKGHYVFTELSEHFARQGINIPRRKTRRDPSRNFTQ